MIDSEDRVPFGLTIVNRQTIMQHHSASKPSRLAYIAKRETNSKANRDKAKRDDIIQKPSAIA